MGPPLRLIYKGEYIIVHASSNCFAAVQREAAKYFPDVTSFLDVAYYSPNLDMEIRISGETLDDELLDCEEEYMDVFISEPECKQFMNDPSLKRSLQDAKRSNHSSAS